MSPLVVVHRVRLEKSSGTSEASKCLEGGGEDETRRSCFLERVSLRTQSAKHPTDGSPRRARLCGRGTPRPNREIQTGVLVASKLRVW